MNILWDGLKVSNIIFIAEHSVLYTVDKAKPHSWLIPGSALL